jgi:type IV pilus assembly protein PilE
MSAAFSIRRRAMSTARAGRGFSLVELLLTVTVVGILAAIAIPSYSAYLVRGQRAAAKTALLQAAQFLERNYTSTGCYNFTTPAACQGGAGTATALLPGFVNSPTDGGPFTYTIALSAVAAQNFTLTAAPCATSGSCPAGSNTTFNDPDCGTLSLTNTGAKSASGTLPPATCWQR